MSGKKKGSNDSCADRIARVRPATSGGRHGSNGLVHSRHRESGMTTKMRSSIPLACTAMAGLLLAACNSTAIRVGGAPEASVKNCVAAAARELRVPPASIAADKGSTPRDGVYTVNLKVGPQGRFAVCTTDENSAVIGVVYKRPE